MLPLSLLLAIAPAHAVDATLSDAPYNGDLQLALDAIGAGDTLTIDQFVEDQGTVTKTLNGTFTIQGATTCDPIEAGCPWGWGEGTTVEINGNAGGNEVVLQDLAISSGVDIVEHGLNIIDKNASLTRVSFSGFDGYAPSPAEGSAFTWRGAATNLVVMDDCYVSNNAAPAVRIFDGDAEIYDSTFESNGSDGAFFRSGFVFDEDDDTFRGGGLSFVGDELILGEGFLEDPADPTSAVVKRGNRFQNNTAVEGGGAYIKANSGTIAGNIFEYNVANDYNGYSEAAELSALGATGVVFNGNGLGGGAYIINSGTTGTLDVKWNTFAGNWGWDGAGVHFQDPEDVVFQNNVVAQNWAVHIGGGLSMIHEDSSSNARPQILNNTLVGNLAGLTRTFLLVQVVGGGGNARIEGLIPEFKGNVVTHAPYGGGVLGKAIDGPFEPGDDFNSYWRYNLFYFNCDITNCFPNDSGDSELTGNYAQYALHPSNTVETEPDYIYFGDPREPSVLSDNDPYPDVFCLNAFSVGVGAGDPDRPNLDDNSYGSDVGHCGGTECFYWNRDRDQDGWLQHQDCLDNPDEAVAGQPLPEEINPDAEEVCDYLDNDCNGVIDDNFVNKWYFDGDSDGDGAASGAGILACDVSELPDGGVDYVEDNTDCDDTNQQKNGNLSEVCDGLDNNCDGFVNEEENLDAALMYPDKDGDLFGSQLASPELVCTTTVGGVEVFYPVTPNGEPEDYLTEVLPQEPFKYYTVGDDCNDNDASIKPGAVELCDEIDQNCNLDPYDVAEGELYYLDTDGDGWGELSTVVAVCDGQELPEGNYVANGGDCDETNVAVNNGAEESCDGLDNDCNGIVDDNPVDGVLLYEDFDNDGFGNPATALRACSGAHGASYTASVGGDCDDSDASVGECSECGCQAAPTTGSIGFLGAGLLAVLGLRRRR